MSQVLRDFWLKDDLFRQIDEHREAIETLLRDVKDVWPDACRQLLTEFRSCLGIKDPIQQLVRLKTLYRDAKQVKREAPEQGEGLEWHGPWQRPDQPKPRHDAEGELLAEIMNQRKVIDPILRDLKSVWPDAFQQLEAMYNESLTENDPLQQLLRLQAVHRDAVQARMDAPEVGEGLIREDVWNRPGEASEHELFEEIVALLELPDSMSIVFSTEQADLFSRLSSNLTENNAAEKKKQLVALRADAAALKKKAVDLHYSTERSSTVIAELSALVPWRQRDLRSEFSQSLASFDPDTANAFLTKIQKELNDLKAESPKRSQAAVTFVNETKPAALKELPFDRKVELLTDLRLGDASSLEERTRAMALLYENMELEESFKKTDDELRQNVLQQLKNDELVRNASRNWNGMNAEAKVKALKQALAIQCQQIGIDPPPPVKLYSDPTVKVDEDKKLTCAGYYSPQERSIYLNDDSATFKGDFDDALDTIIHENTHNYQRKLVDDLVAGRLLPGDPNYQQAVLFQLNTLKPGYVNNGPGYKEQPLERHAWLAGGEARRLFSEDAITEARVLIEEMQKWQNEHSSERERITNWCDFVTKAIDSGRTNEITRATRTYGMAFKDLVQDNAKPQTSDDVKPTGLKAEADEFVKEMQAWVKKHPSYAAKVDRLVEDLEDIRPNQARRLAQKLELTKSIFQGYVKQDA